jgi:hypothetical protein
LIHLGNLLIFYFEIGLEPKPQLLQVSPSLVEPSDFDCVLCCRTLWDPIVTPCGHTYCRVSCQIILNLIMRKNYQREGERRRETEIKERRFIKI